MDRPWKWIKAKFTNVQDEGAIGATDIFDVAETLRSSVALESFQCVTEGAPDGVGFDRDSTWNFKDPDWEGKEAGDAPDWFFLRSKLLATSSPKKFSRVTAMLRPTTDLAGLKYVAPSGGLDRLFMVNWSINGESSHSMSAAVSFYRGQSWPGSSVRQSSAPFDTGITPVEDGKYPFILKDTELIVMSPGDELRWRFEYFGASAARVQSYTFEDDVLSPVVTDADDENPSHLTVRVKQHVVSIVSLGPVDSFQDTVDEGGNAFPLSVGDHYSSLFSDASWRSSGLTPTDIIGS